MARSKGLTLEALVQYDDIITDALVDKVYYWTVIRKNRGGRFTASRGLHEEEIADIVRKHVIWEKDPAEAVQKLLQLSGLRKFVASLKDEKDKEQFRRHLRRYVNIYMPDCPFEVTTTNRYMITEHEASVTARRDINPREEIKYLAGVKVAMTEEQETTLELARKDFSLVYSSRNKTRSLFLGPARFANHDCDPNAKLSTKGHEGMQIVAMKPIDQGDEITVSYGGDYFGDDNKECLCHTCEDRQQNGWAPMKSVSDSEDDYDEEDEEEKIKTSSKKSKTEPSEDTQSSKKRRRALSLSDDTSRDSTPAPKRARIAQKSPPRKSRIDNLLRKKTLKKAHSTSSLRQEIPVSSIEDSCIHVPTSPHISRELRNQQRDGLLTVSLGETSSSRDNTPESSIAVASPKSSQSTDATSMDEEHPIDVKIPTTKIEPATIRDHPALGVATVKEEIITTTVSAPWPSPPAEDETTSDLSDLSSSYSLDSETDQIVKRKPRPVPRTTRSKSRFTINNSISTPIPTSPTPFDDTLVPNDRKPGDYMTSSSLLSAKYSKWVECQTCDIEFVQQDGYNTRKECPRCERHSKLYGYAWPKTEREGKADQEERVRDHRTVHRFVDPDEERELKKTKAKKLVKEEIRERFGTPRSVRVRESESVEVDSGRRRRRVRQTM